MCAFTVTDGTTVAVLINASRTETASLDMAALGLEGIEMLGCVGTDAEAVLAGRLPPMCCAVARLTE